MNCLPIVNRELRVAARKSSTFWLRVAAALTALVIGGGCMILSLFPGSGTFQLGRVLFSVLTWLCLAAGLSAGLFFTSDCLSEEKREGTLGLLFLTDLRGYDVVLGKLLATSLRGFYALLAVLPILSLTLCMGGVTGTQYWQSALALVNALFFSLAAGMAVSAVSRDSQKAMMGTLMVLLLLVLGGPVADWIIGMVRLRGFEPLWSMSSPAYVLAMASAFWSHYWAALVVTQLLGWGMLAVAAALAPHTWQVRKRTGASHTQGWSYAWRFGGARRRLRLRRKLVGWQPVAWLVRRERWQTQGVWAMTLLVAGSFVAVLIVDLPRQAWLVWSWIGGLFILMLYLWAASQACRFFVEARRSGLLELLLATPLNERQIVAGHWQALLRMFGLPVLLLLGVHVAGTTLSQVAFQRMATQASTVTTSTVTNQSGKVTSHTVSVISTVEVLGKTGTNAVPPPGGFTPVGAEWQTTVAITTAVAGALSTAANLLALCWFGMWMGLTSRTANLATLKTILFVQVIPWFVFAFGGTLVAGLLMAGVFLRSGAPQSAAWLVWWPLLGGVFTAAVAVAKDIGFIVWSRRKLYSSFREEAARSLGQPRFVAPRPMVTGAAAPPIIVGPR